MCQANVFLDEEEVAQNVVRLEVMAEGVRVQTLFEEPVIMHATLKEIDFLKNRVILQPVEGSVQ